MNLKKIAISLLITASSLLAIEAVTNLSVSAPHNSGTTTNDASIDFTWTPPATVAKYYYKLDTNATNYNLVGEGGYQTLNSSGSSLTVTATASGSYYLHLVAVDSGDATSAPVLVQVTSAIDIDAATVTMSPDGGAITTDNNSITLTGTESGTIYYTVDGTTPTTASNVYSTPLVLGVSATIKALHVDTVGNTGSVTSKAFTITNNPDLLKANDDTAVDGTTISTSTTNALKVSVTDLTRYKYKKSTSATWTTVQNITTTIDISGLASGTHIYDVVGGDAYNFQADSAKTTITFTVDNTAPSGLAVLVNAIEADETNSTTVTYADNFTFALTSNDVNNSDLYYTIDGSNPDNTSTVYTGPVTTTATVATDSTAQITVKMIAYDALSNASEIKSVTFTIDKQAPTITMPATQTYSTALPVSFSSDDVNAVLYSQVTTSITPPSTTDMNTWDVGATATIGDPTPSTYKYLHVVAIDEVGNKSAVSSETFSYAASGTSILSADTTLDFGSLALGSSQSATLTITNSGTDAITISEANITVSGSDFNVSSTTCANSALSATSTCTINLLYTPGAKGATTATLSIAYDGTNSTELNTTLSGSSLGTAPTITTTSITTAEDTNVSALIAATDIDNDTLTFSVTSDVNASKGTLTMDGSGSYTYAPALNFNGTDSFTIVANDGDLNSSAQVIDIVVTPVDDAISFSAITDVNTTEDLADFNITLVATDSDTNGTIEYTASLSDVSLASVTFVGDVLVVSQTANANGVLVIDVNATLAGSSVVNSFTINISAVNDVPTFDTTVADVNTTEDFTSFDRNISVTDVDADTITYSATSSNTSIATVSMSDNTLSVSSVANASGDVNITVSAEAGSDTITDVFLVSVAAVDDAPVISALYAQRVQTTNTALITIDVNATDVEGDAITYSASSSDTTIATVVDINSTTGLMDINTTSTSGVSNITVIASSTDLNTTQIFTVTVRDTNITLPEETTSSYDSDTNETTFSIVAGSGTLDLVENDDGKASATLTANTNVNIVIDTVGADVNVDENGTLSTSLSPDANTTSLITLSADGNSTNSVTISTVETKVEISGVDTNTTVNASGDIASAFTMQSKSVSLSVSGSTGKITPVIPNLAIPSVLPAGTTATVDNTAKTITFVFDMPATLEFD